MLMLEFLLHDKRSIVQAGDPSVQAEEALIHVDDAFFDTSETP